MQPNNTQPAPVPAQPAVTPTPTTSSTVPPAPVAPVMTPNTTPSPAVIAQQLNNPATGNEQGNFPTPQVSTASNAPDQKNSTEAKPKNPNSTQNSLLVSEIHDNMLIMNDGSFRAIIACKSINFDLMSSTEQDSIELFFQGFLNSLYFPIQIFVRSQRVNMEPYLKYLEDLRNKQENMLLSNLMEDYMNFIDQISIEANIMKKSFFVVVEFSPYGDIDSQTNSTKNLFSNLFNSDKQQKITVSAKSFEKAKDEIENRVNTVINGLGQIGVTGYRVETRELATIFYNIYNPDTAVNEPLTDFRRFTNLYTAKSPTKPEKEATNG
jgi:hypothetical protein